MTLNQALALVKSRKGAGEKKPYYLVSGFEPLHLKTFLCAHLLERLPCCDVEILQGIYGDFPGNLAMGTESRAIGAAVVIEWSDIDPRLGLRSTGGWTEEVKPDILSSASERYSNIEMELARLAGRMPSAVVPPCLPLPPFGNTIQAQASTVELEIERQLAAFLSRVSRLPGVRIVQRSHLDMVRTEERLDVQTELIAGFPYTVAFADVLAGAVTGVLCQAPPKKGLITDLDDTLWAGTIGEAGVDAISWGPQDHSRIHGLYQQMLGHLASCGVLLAVCSKNELSSVEPGLGHPDLLLKPGSFFPVCVNWEPKSQSVSRILEAWNMDEESVVFVDDSPMELEEVKRAFPGIVAIEFPRNNPARLWRMLGELRDLFGRPDLMEEDALRQASIQTSAAIREMGESGTSLEFLEGLDATVTLDWRGDPSDKRPLQLINKTNQFNLNGCRIGEAEWRRCLEKPSTVQAVVSYKDRFGPLGKVSVVLGTRNRDTLKVTHWVMSCRAFSRRVEHHTLAGLFLETGVEWIEFAFEETVKNKPLQGFFRTAGIRPDAEGVYRLARAAFPAQGDRLPHQVLVLKK